MIGNLILSVYLGRQDLISVFKFRSMEKLEVEYDGNLLVLMSYFMLIPIKIVDYSVLNVKMFSFYQSCL